MINQSTVETLRQMRMGAMAQSLEEQLLDHETYVKLSFEERLALLVDAEWSKRQANKLNRYIRSAQLSNPEASIEGIEYHPDRKLDKMSIPASQSQLIRCEEPLFPNEGATSFN
ncbi:ATP-binding protein [Desulfotomaculum sp. 1211_IL3151]|uniref:ATP-binding protein n=1 Tax=Desulfotomaculum sp. 1211_IL3151 TaxID=3084055 RepID=UPI002FDA275F